ncbi:unnamed protein product [Gongylonema pulchrum]|uniref:C-type lectin domain-containing protein n=1 Tax=Gongylonema pulchrum TaxID=637853 RepID=A0A183D9K8_9BILA|nr:unnamed protein product [Gongylonema pulchrum]
MERCGIVTQLGTCLFMWTTWNCGTALGTLANERWKLEWCPEEYKEDRCWLQGILVSSFHEEHWKQARSPVKQVRPDEGIEEKMVTSTGTGLLTVVPYRNSATKTEARMNCNTKQFKRNTKSADDALYGPLIRPILP